MKLEKAWRWFGKSDAVTLDHLVQMDIEGVVTALHHIPTGEVWPKEEILAVKSEIESRGMRWSVVESVPVSEQIKTAGPMRDRHIENYRRTIRNLLNLLISFRLGQNYIIFKLISTHHQFGCTPHQTPGGVNASNARRRQRITRPDVSPPISFSTS
jgi:hypothetical protein